MGKMRRGVQWVGLSAVVTLTSVAVLAQPHPHETPPTDPWMPRPTIVPAGVAPHCEPWVRGPYVSIQVNVDAEGCNILGDAANEPSMAIDLTNPSRVVIGWRQFDTIDSNFRQAGWGYSHDAGATWTFPGVLETGVFRSDPVLAADADGNIHYLSLRVEGGSYWCNLWQSTDGGMSWQEPIFAYGGDKSWFTVDTTAGPGRGNLYQQWGPWASCCGDKIFTRSIDAGASFEVPSLLPAQPGAGTLAVGPDGELYISGHGGSVLKSLNAWDQQAYPAFADLGEPDLGGTYQGSYVGPNPVGLLGQTWIACDHSGGTSRGYVYLLNSVVPNLGGDPMDVMFVRSVSGGARWSSPVRVNDDVAHPDAWQWFGTMSVAPNGRIDVFWNDTRASLVANWSELYYSASVDAGRTWTPGVPVGRAFDSWIGWPRQNKIGDYYHSISDDAGVSLAYAATYNGEQDVYFLRILADCNINSLPDVDEIAADAALDANGNRILDECEPDTDADGLLDDDDADIDADGVANAADFCPLGPPGVRVRTDGSPFGDFVLDCHIDLADYRWVSDLFCLPSSGPGITPPNRGCRNGFDFDADSDNDLHDVAIFQRLFGQTGD